MYCTAVLAKRSVSDLNLFSCFENFQTEMVAESSTSGCQAHLQLGCSWLLVLEGSSLPVDLCGCAGTRQPRRTVGSWAVPWEGAVVLRQEGWMEQVWTRGLGAELEGFPSRSGCCKEYHSPGD